jgi:hypothetical protein
MHILLDSRDLINVVEHEHPVSVEEFGKYLNDRGHQIVFCFSNVRELAVPLSCGVTFLEIRPLLQRLEQLPHVCLKEVGIFPMEIQAAVDAFTSGNDYQAPSPYVGRWDDTVVGGSPIEN